MKLWKIILIAFISYFPNHLFANKIFTVADGNWEDTTVWLNGNLPGYSFGDTVEINHCVFFNENIQLNSGALLTIADSGKICGYNFITLNTGSEFDIFGRIYFDTIFVHGYLYVNNNNQAFIGHCIIYAGGGHGLEIGPLTFTYYPFTCSCTFDSIPPLPPIPQDTVIEESFEIDLYPNPFHDVLHFKNYTAIDFIFITDGIGRLILRKEIEADYLDLKNLTPGPYFIHFFLKNQEQKIKKIIKI